MDLRKCRKCGKDVDIDNSSGFAYVNHPSSVELVPSKAVTGSFAERKTPGKTDFYHHECSPPSATNLANDEAG